MNARVASILAAALFCVSAGALHAAVPSGPPSSKNPHGELPLLAGADGRPLAIPGGLLSKLYDQYPVEAKKVEQMIAAANGGKLNQLKLLEVGTTYMNIKLMQRGTEHLLMWGEPAAIGFHYELDRLAKVMNDLVKKIRDDQYFKSKLPREAKAIHASARSKINALKQKVDPLIANGKFEEALLRLDQLTLPLQAMFVFYEPKEFDWERQEIADRASKILDPLKELQGKIARREIGKLRSQLLPDYERLWRGVDDLVIKVRQAEPVDPGPSLMKKFASQWADTQMRGMRCQALDWMIENTFPSGAATTEKTEWQAQNKSLLENHQEYTKKMAELVAALIEADVVRATPEEAEQLYPEYLKSISPLLALSDLDIAAKAARGRAAETDASFRGRVEEALAKLADKSERLAASVAAYDLATSDLLKWRSRVAKARAAKTQQGYLALDLALQRAASRSSNELERLLTDDKSQLNTLAIQTFARVPTNFISGKIVGEKVFVRDGIGSRAAAAYPVMTRLSKRTYAGFQGDPQWIADAIARLESDLLLNPQRPVPLTLEAQLAIASARRGDIQEAGGRIDAMLIESVITRQTSLTPRDWGMIRIGDLIVEESKDSRNSDQDPRLERLKQVQARFAIKPLWLRHEYFYVDLPDSEND
jgi:hypothetical protein